MRYFASLGRKMQLPTFCPPVGPSPGTTHKYEIKLRETEFGDGYSQITPAGLNHIRLNVPLKWDALLYDQAQEIERFFVERQGNLAFYYRPFGLSQTLKWTCKEFEFKFDQGVWSGTANLVQSFTNER